MKNVGTITIVLALLNLFTGCTTNEQKSSESDDVKIEIAVNPTIDLFGLISQFAGDNQYTELLLPEYKTEVENYFGSFKTHPSVDFAKDCNIRYQINGDAPMALAVYIGPPPALEPRLDLSNLPANLDPRWDSTLISAYLENARIFESESNFMEFYISQKEYQELALDNLKEMFSREQIFPWYNKFFGYYPEKIKMYLALQNGSCNYGYPVSYPDGEVEFVSVIGARFPDRDGIPRYPADWYIPLIVHEYAHSYINPLIKSKPEEFKELGEAMLLTQRAKMIERGYNVWNVILQEYIVRACTILYLEQNEGKRKAMKNIKYDIGSGFIEIEGLVKLLDDYENNRDNYKNIESFLPEIKKYFESYLTKFEQKKHTEH